jgi:hypothetical protein
VCLSGHYQLSATILFMGERAKSQAVPVEIRASSKQDRAIAAKLRAENDEDESSWCAFIESNWSTPDTKGLSETALEQLALYLYLHRVTYGPDAVASLDPEAPWKFSHGVLEGQAALIRLEILRAAGKPAAGGVEAAILERWPALSWWVEQVRRKAGLLTRLRSSDGADSDDALNRKNRPYTQAK